MIGLRDDIFSEESTDCWKKKKTIRDNERQEWKKKTKKKNQI